MKLKAKTQSPLTKMFSHRSPSQVNVKEPVKEHLWDLHFAEFGRYVCEIWNGSVWKFSQTLPTVAIKEVCTRWFYNQGTVSVGFSILYFNIMRNCVKVTNLWQSSFLSI